MPEHSIITPDWSRLEGRLLRHGAHSSCDDGTCAMEAYALACGIPHTDRPEIKVPDCAPRSVARLIRSINDAAIWESDKDRTETLLPFLRMLPTADRSLEVERKRAYLAAHFALARVADLAERVKRADIAEKLRVFPAPTSRAECLAMQAAANSIRSDLRSADAAYAAADARTAAEAAAYAADAGACAAAAAAYADAGAAGAAAAAGARKRARREALLSMLSHFLEVEA